MVVINFALSLFMSIALVPLFMRYAHVLGLVDQPDGVRKIHSKQIPKSGGLAISIAVLLPTIYLSPQLGDLAPMIIGSIIIVIGGFLDDRYDLNYKWKFFGQILAIAVFLIGTPDLSLKSFFFELELPFWLTKVILFIFILGVTNAVNLSDGLDGLAGGITLISLCFVAYLASEAQLTNALLATVALMGALLGFLRYNTHPASIFMGDTGSQFIGFVLASLAIYVTQNSESAVSPILPLFIVGIPILDTLMVMIVRRYNGKSMFAPDKNHTHHQLMKLGFYHYEAVAALYIIQLAFIALGFFTRFYVDTFLIISYLALTLVIFGSLYLAAKNGLTFHNKNTQALEKERRNLLLRRVNWIYLYSAEITLFFIACTCGLLLYSTDFESIAIKYLILTSVFFAVITRFVLPKNIHITTRILAYTAVVLTLFSFSSSQNADVYGQPLNLMLLVIGLFLILAIRMTRKEIFRLNNLDILVLLALFIAPLLQFESRDGIDTGVLLLRTLTLIYAIEYILSRNPDKHYIFNIVSLSSLLSLYILS